MTISPVLLIEIQIPSVPGARDPPAAGFGSRWAAGAPRSATSALVGLQALPVQPRAVGAVEVTDGHFSVPVQ